MLEVPLMYKFMLVHDDVDRSALVKYSPSRGRMWVADSLHIPEFLRRLPFRRVCDMRRSGARLAFVVKGGATSLNMKMRDQLSLSV